MELEEYNRQLEEFKSDTKTVSESNLLKKYEILLSNIKQEDRVYIINYCLPIYKDSPKRHSNNYINIIKKMWNFKNTKNDKGDVLFLLSLLLKYINNLNCDYNIEIIHLICSVLKPKDLNSVQPIFKQKGFNFDYLSLILLSNQKLFNYIKLFKSYGLKLEVEDKNVNEFNEILSSTDFSLFYTNTLIENNVSINKFNTPNETLFLSILNKMKNSEDYIGDIIPTLVEHGLDVHHLNCEGKNVLHKLFEEELMESEETALQVVNRENIVKIIKEYNISGRLLDKIKKSPAFYIYFKSNEIWLKYFLDIDLGLDDSLDGKTSYFDLSFKHYKLEAFLNRHNKYIPYVIKLPFVFKEDNSATVDTPEELEHKEYLKSTYFYKSWERWLDRNPEKKEKIQDFLQNLYFPNIKENEDISVADDGSSKNTKEKELTVELYTIENFDKFVKNIDGPNRDNSQKFKKDSIKSNHANRIKIYAKSALLLEKIEQLKIDFPHFSEVIDHIENHCVLQNAGDGTFYIPPLMLAGGPGIGKTFFCHTVSNIIETSFQMLSMESMSSSFELTGSSEQWGNSSPGKIFVTLRDSKTINPIFLLDELDKCRGSENFNPSNALLPLLEKYTASSFTDECVSIPFDASKIIWISTANELEKISAPIKSRFDIFTVPNPNFSERKNLSNGIYKTILKNHSWGHKLSADLPEEIQSILADDTSPGAARDIRRNLTTACSKTIKHGRTDIIPADLSSSFKPQKMLWDMPLDNHKTKEDNK